MSEDRFGESKTDALSIPPRLKDKLTEFSKGVLAAFGDRVVSVSVVGSAATPDFQAATSDVNVLVVFSELNLADLQTIAPQAQQYWKRHRISPRFISRRNLLGMVRYFPIDAWTMRRRHIVLHGEDVLAGVDVQRADLVWQLRHEVKGLRMRAKQQYWRTWNSSRYARENLKACFTSLTHLFRVALYLKGVQAPDRNDDLLDEVGRVLGMPGDSGRALLAYKRRSEALNRSDIFPRYENLLEIIRQLDEFAETLQP